MSDYELLKLAAKAAGLKLSSYQSQDTEKHGLWLAREHAMPEKGYSRDWNPLADDGDAFRLMVRLGLSIHRYPNSVFVTQYGRETGHLGDGASLNITDSDEATTRRIIVCAAAEIGKAQP